MQDFLMNPIVLVIAIVLSPVILWFSVELFALIGCVILMAAWCVGMLILLPFIAIIAWFERA